MNTCRTNRREQIIEQILIVECSLRYSQHVKYTIERFKRPAAVKNRHSSPPLEAFGVTAHELSIGIMSNARFFFEL